jgi:TPR repeat protein
MKRIILSLVVLCLCGFQVFAQGVLSAKEIAGIRKAAEQGGAEAQIMLGVMYEQGGGVPKDMTEAVKWFRKAAEQGDANAQIMLGNCYDKGQGVSNDKVKAYMWYNLAATAGEKTASKALKRVEKEMTPEQIAEAQKLSRERKPKKEATKK